MWLNKCTVGNSKMFFYFEKKKNSQTVHFSKVDRTSLIFIKLSILLRSTHLMHHIIIENMLLLSLIWKIFNNRNLLNHLTFLQLTNLFFIKMTLHKAYHNHVKPWVLQNYNIKINFYMISKIKHHICLGSDVQVKLWHIFVLK